MTEGTRTAETVLRALLERARAAILDIDAHAAPFGEDADGFVTGGYIISVGSLHRALGVVGHSSRKCTPDALCPVCKPAPKLDARAVAGLNTVGGPLNQARVNPEVADLQARLASAQTELARARQHAKGIVQGPSDLRMAEAILAEHEDNVPRGANREKLDDELCRVCALASIIKQQAERLASALGAAHETPEDDTDDGCPICEGGNGTPCNSHFGV